ncbi:MAG: hypothetical protein ACPHIA_06225, partial [Alphaproteobacteria bacterium]
MVRIAPVWAKCIAKSGAFAKKNCLVEGPEKPADSPMRAGRNRALEYITLKKCDNRPSPPPRPLFSSKKGCDLSDLPTTE